MSKLEALADRLDSILKGNHEAHAILANNANRLDEVTKEIYALIKRQTVPRIITVESVTSLFTEKQLEFLKVTNETDHVRVAFIQYMPTGFGDVANRVESVRGKYFEKTASTAPHFKIPK